MRLTGTTLALLCLLTTAALAVEHVQVPAVSFQCNADGAVMTDSAGQVYYFGRSCDAFVPSVGQGRWLYTASGIALDLGPGKGLMFQYVEPPCDSLPFC